MVETPVQYQKAQEELRFMEDWLARLRREEPDANVKDLTKPSDRKVIARLHEEPTLMTKRFRLRNAFSGNGLHYFLDFRQEFFRIQEVVGIRPTEQFDGSR